MRPRAIEYFCGGGIEVRLASRPAGRRANPPKADIVGNSTSVEWGVAE